MEQVTMDWWIGLLADLLLVFHHVVNKGGKSETDHPNPIAFPTFYVNVVAAYVISYRL